MTNISAHYRNDRLIREKVIKAIGEGNIVKAVRWDRGHPNGAEIHKVTDTGIIIIYNERTGKLVTKIIARPNQIRRYWRDGNAPKEIINKAIEHSRNGQCV